MMRALVLCLCLLGVPFAMAGEPDEWVAWATAAGKQHPLAGTVYSETEERPEIFGGLLQRLKTDRGKLWRPTLSVSELRLPSGIALLGEVHDNPEHHRLRAWLIAGAMRAQPDRRPAVVLEHIRADKQPALDRFKALGQECCRLTTAADLLRLLEWDKSGWPPAELFRPLFDAVIVGQLPIYPGDPPRERVKAVARGGAEALAVEERTRLGLDTPLPAPLTEALSQELADSHCGALPPQAIPGMAAAQRYRDAHLADALLSAEKLHGAAILIAGNGHVRSDRGVPWHIRQRKPDAKVMSVHLLEVEEGKTEPAAYVPRDPDGRPAADLVIFTPRAKRGDPCQGFMKNRK